MTNLTSYDRDADGDETVYDGLRGGYRWMTSEEKAPRRAAEAAERERIAALRAEQEAAAADRDARLSPEERFALNANNAIGNPHKPLGSHPSYGRSDPDLNINWPGGGDYIPPRAGE